MKLFLKIPSPGRKFFKKDPYHFYCKGHLRIWLCSHPTTMITEDCEVSIGITNWNKPSPSSSLLLGTHKPTWQKCQHKLLCLFCVKLIWMSAWKTYKTRNKFHRSVFSLFEIILMCHGFCVIYKEECKLHGQKEYGKWWIASVRNCYRKTEDSNHTCTVVRMKI